MTDDFYPNGGNTCADCNPTQPEKASEWRPGNGPNPSGGNVNSMCNPPPDRKNEIWVCGHTRKCGWKGKQSELVFVEDKDRFKIKSSTGTCPKCGNDAFYVRAE